MNKIVLIGRLTKDAELKAFEGKEKSVLNFTLAVDRDYVASNNEKITDFIPIVYWTQYGESLQKYLLKGRQICVSGKLYLRTYESQDKGKRYVAEVFADDIKFLDQKKESNTI